MEAREPGFIQHAQAAAFLAEAIGREMHLSWQDVRDLQIAALLHDIGKSEIPDSVLYKPAALTDSEYALIKSHTVIGERLISMEPGLQVVAKIIRSHHERFDGTGYPDQLADDRIPQGARVLTAVDIFLVLTTDKPYRPAWGVREVLEELEQMAGSYLDPNVVSVLVQIVEKMSLTEIVKQTERSAKRSHDADSHLLLFEGPTFEESIAFFNQNFDNFLNQYEGDYIAILDSIVVDSDKDWSLLAQRVYDKYGYLDIFMPRVERSSHIARIPSPRL